MRTNSPTFESNKLQLQTATFNTFKRIQWKNLLCRKYLKM